MDHDLGPYRPRPRGDFDDTVNYMYLDIVRYRGSSYINCNLDTIDGVSSIGIAPAGMPQSELFWQCLADKGDKGETADHYTSYSTVSNGIWNYNNGDKIFIPDDAPETLEIINTYDGCCGIIITKKDLILPRNSLKSIDYNYIPVRDDGDYYFYTFTYTNTGSDLYAYIWHRTVVRRD